ncbi:MAG: alpha-2-macroglobulin family protein, partial [Cyanobacteria bacterium J06639_1]
PTRAQVTLAVANESVLQLTGYRFPDLVETVYASQPISTRFADNRPQVALAPPPHFQEKGWGYGGGFSAGAADPRIRRDFRPLAYFNGAIVTDENGRANANFSLPDDLTTWRVLAIASTPDLKFGSADSTFVSSQPLLTNPVLPQFARLGDVFDVGVAVTNAADRTGTLNIQAEVGSDPSETHSDVPPLLLTTADREVQSQTLETPMESGTQAYRFRAIAAQVGRSLVRFQTQLGDLADGFEIPLDVKALLPSEQTIETGVTDSRATIPFRVDDRVMPNSGGLQVTLASTLLPDIVAPTRDLMRRDSLPFLEPAASRLAIAAQLQTLRQTYGQLFPEFDPASEAATALEQLQTLQSPNGGFKTYPGDNGTSVWGTAYAARSIAVARDAGFSTGALKLTGLQKYLEATLSNPSRIDDNCGIECRARRQLDILLALDALGDTRTDFLDRIYSMRESLDEASQFRLARYLSQFPQWQEAATALAQELQEGISIGGRSAVVNTKDRWGYWGHSQTVLQAEALRLAIAREADPEAIARAVRGLLDERRNGIWPRGSYGNAIAIGAVLDYAARQPEPPNFNASVRLDADSIGSTQFQGYQQTSLDLDVPMRDLPKGDRDLVVEKNGSGELHYLAAYQYRLPAPHPGRFAGLRVTRTVRNAGTEDILHRMDLKSGDRPLTLAPGQVFDIEVRVVVDRPVNQLVITDPLPAGLEPVDTSFRTTAANLQEPRDSWQISYQALHRDRVVAFADRLNAGVYTLHYLARSVTPGTFLWPGATARLQYEPETLGRTSAEFLRIEAEF